MRNRSFPRSSVNFTLPPFLRGRLLKVLIGLFLLSLGFVLVAILLLRTPDVEAFDKIPHVCAKVIDFPPLFPKDAIPVVVEDDRKVEVLGRMTLDGAKVAFSLGFEKVASFSNVTTMVTERYNFDGLFRFETQSPSLVWVPSEQHYLLFTRIASFFCPELAQTEPLRYRWVSYIFTRTYTRDFRALDPGRLVGFPFPIPHVMDELYAGPEDPRTVTVGDKLLVNFNLLTDCKDGNRHDCRRKFFALNHNQQSMVEFHIHDFPDKNVEKNWTPFEHDGALHFVYSFDPLVILRCSSSTGNCTVAYSAVGSQWELIKPHKQLLRGGTPLLSAGVEGYYYGFEHITYVHGEEDRLYRPVLVVLGMTPVPHIVFVSDPFEFPGSIIQGEYPGRKVLPVYFNLVEYPVGLVEHDNGEIILTLHLEWHFFYRNSKALALRVRGVREILDKVIRLDKEIVERQRSEMRDPKWSASHVGTTEKYLKSGVDAFVTRTKFSDFPRMEKGPDHPLL